MDGKTIKVGVGILARNEEADIANLIGDLGRQTLLDDDRFSIDVFVVANGCTDRTVDVAEQALSLAPFRKLTISTSIHDLPVAGKSNAWNELVHRIAPDDIAYMFFLDADIRIPEKESLKLMLDSLMSSPTAIVAIDASVKDIELEQPRGVVERLIRAGTGTAEDKTRAIAGACYCVLFSEVRAIRMPIGLPGEDGYLRAMLLTSSFAHEERMERHLFVPGAYHVFESLRNLPDVLKHNVRLAIATAVNAQLFWHIRALRRQGVDVAEHIRERNLADPDWINDLIRERLKYSYTPVGKRYLLRRLKQACRHPRRWSPKVWAIALLGTAFDCIVFVKATVLMRRGAGAGYW